MLAQRASSSPELKLLMKVVASGGANAEQLKVFQGHIDDLTATLERRKIAPYIPTPTRPNYAIDIPGATSVKTPIAAVAKPGLSYQPPYQAPAKPKVYVPPKPDISGVAIEFSAGNGDRYLFPRFSIMEYQPGSRRAKASFVVVRKGNKTLGESYNPKKQYYQPITLEVASENSRVMEALFKGVSSVTEARNYIHDIKSKHEPAESGHLAMRLPSIAESVDHPGNSATPLSSRRRSLGDTLTRASLSLNIETKPVKASRKLLDDKDSLCQYCFISCAGQEKVDGVTICEDCLPLLEQQAQRRLVPEAMASNSSGPLVLMLPGAVR